MDSRNLRYAIRNRIAHNRVGKAGNLGLYREINRLSGPVDWIRSIYTYY